MLSDELHPSLPPPPPPLSPRHCPVTAATRATILLPLPPPLLLCACRARKQNAKDQVRKSGQKSGRKASGEEGDDASLSLQEKNEAMEVDEPLPPRKPKSPGKPHKLKPLSSGGSSSVVSHLTDDGDGTLDIGAGPVAREWRVGDTPAFPWEQATFLRETTGKTFRIRGREFHRLWQEGDVGDEATAFGSIRSKA